MGGKTLTRADLADAVVRKIGLPRNESQELVELVLDQISSALSRGEGVKLSSFGSFGVREKGQTYGDVFLWTPEQNIRNRFVDQQLAGPRAG